MKNEKIRLGELRKTYEEYLKKRRKKKQRKYEDWLTCPLPGLYGTAQNQGLGKKLKILAYSDWL